MGQEYTPGPCYIVSRLPIVSRLLEEDLPATQSSYRIGVDIGGTFTDLVMSGPDGVFWTKKVSSTPDDYARGILEGTRALLRELKVDPSRVRSITS